MKRPSFLQGVVVALGFAFFASAIIAFLTPFVGFAGVVRVVIPMLGLAYLLYLFSRSHERIGRVTTISLWAVLAVVTWWLAPPLPLYVLIHVAALWLVRSLYFYSGVLPSLLDLGLGALGIVAAAWAIGQSGSVFLGVWCFFLVQALFVAIPASIRPARKARRIPASDNENFDKARRQADQALNQLLTQ